MKNILNNRWLTLFTLLLVIANIVTLTLLWVHRRGEGRPDGKMPPPPRGQVFEFINHELKLDSAQQEAYRKLKDEHQEYQRAVQDSLKKQKDAFFALLQQPAVADSVLQKAARQIGEQEQQIELVTFRHFKKLRALCNAEQQRKFDTIIQDVLKRMGPPRNRMEPPPPPGDEKDRPGGFPPPPGQEHEPPGDKPTGDRPPPENN